MKKTVFVAITSMIMAACSAQSSTSEYEPLTPFEPNLIEQTGVPVCDSYFAQLQTCLKGQVPADSYAEVIHAINTAKQELLYLEYQDAVEVCRLGFERASQEFAGKCSFNWN